MRKLALAFLFFFFSTVFISFKKRPAPIRPSAATTVSGLWNDTIHYPEEKHFANVQQLTFGGDNAEAYFSYDSKWLIFQRTNPKEGISCDRIFIGKIPRREKKTMSYDQTQRRCQWTVYNYYR